MTASEKEGCDKLRTLRAETVKLDQALRLEGPLIILECVGVVKKCEGLSCAGAALSRCGAIVTPVR